MHYVPTYNEAIAIAKSFVEGRLYFRDLESLEFAYATSLGVSEMEHIDKDLVESFYKNYKARFTAVA